jgi:hypothetical protein
MKTHVPEGYLGRHFIFLKTRPTPRSLQMQPPKNPVLLLSKPQNSNSRVILAIIRATLTKQQIQSLLVRIIVVQDYGHFIFLKTRPTPRSLQMQPPKNPVLLLSKPQTSSLTKQQIQSLLVRIIVVQDYGPILASEEVWGLDRRSMLGQSSSDNSKNDSGVGISTPSSGGKSPNRVSVDDVEYAMSHRL